ncbi:MAG TPA: 50S ribosomal protein L22 [Armatimonadetes bacterium]|jgi:large subunit ribosomal protein L22|nr:50S ribosomal protein L22 [Armatimonadota bacterium]HCM72955.1 50S ribosomal protein L22 [Armatimonadota bacterium]
MQVRAVAKFVKCKPLMVRQVARELRGKPAQQMVDVLRFKPGRGAFVLRKVIASAMANAQENHAMDPRQLIIAEIKVDEGPAMKRIIARAMGRANRILKRTAHITVVVADDFPTEERSRGEGKAKPRPKLAVPAGKKKAAPKAAAAVAEEVKEEVTEEVVETPVEAEVTTETEVTAEAPTNDAGEEAPETK